MLNECKNILFFNGGSVAIDTDFTDSYGNYFRTLTDLKVAAFGENHKLFELDRVFFIELKKFVPYDILSDPDWDEIFAFLQMTEEGENTELYQEYRDIHGAHYARWVDWEENQKKIKEVFIGQYQSREEFLTSYMPEHPLFQDNIRHYLDWDKVWADYRHDFHEVDGYYFLA